MLLRIEVFPPVGKGNSNRTPSKILYSSPATVLNRLKKKKANGGDDNDATEDDGDDDTVGGDNDIIPDAGMVVRIGRKGDNVDILFETDRSISREHALLRFVGKPPRAKEAPKKRTRGKKSSGEAEARAGATTPTGWCVAPRNDIEAQACDESPYGMCLVLENKGKAGSYIASRDDAVPANNGDTARENDDGDDSDATTDDEAPRHSSFSQTGVATSLATQMGEILVSQSNQSSAQKLPALSESIQDFFGSDTPVKLTKIDPGENQVLSSLEDDNDDSSILIQFGVSFLPTIKITRIPMSVVFSSGVPSSIQDSLFLCGGLAREAGSLPCKGEATTTATTTTTTTHLVAMERTPVAKQLMAWSYGIPIVSPDFVHALKNHTRLEDPFPDPSDHPPPAADKMDFWESKKPRPDLLSGYLVLSVESSPEAEGLAVAAGANLERLYDFDAHQKPKKPTKAKVASFVKRAKELVGTKQQQQVVLLSASTTTTKSKSSNPNTTLLFQKLKDELSIPTVSPKMLAKTITQQSSWIVGLAPPTEDQHTTATSDSERPAKSKTEPSKPPPADAGTAKATRNSRNEKPRDDDDDSSASSEWELQRKPQASQKRTRDEISIAAAATEPSNESLTSPSQAQWDNNDAGDDEDSGGVDPETVPEKNESKATEESPSPQPRKRPRVEQRERQQDPVPESRKKHQPSKQEDAISENKTKTIVHEDVLRKNKPSYESSQTRLEQADANGWFRPAPRDDRERSKWREMASEAYQRKTGVMLERSATTDRVVVDLENTTPVASIPSSNHNQRHRRPPPQPRLGVPNFKRFRKNPVPRKDKNERSIVLAEASFSSSKHEERVSTEEERELEEQQRLADALFRGDDVSSTKRNAARNYFQ